MTELRQNTNYILIAKKATDNKQKECILRC